MWKSGDDDDDDDKGGMFGFGSGGSMAMSRKMMKDEEAEFKTPKVQPNSIVKELSLTSDLSGVTVAANSLQSKGSNLKQSVTANGNGNVQPVKTASNPVLYNGPNTLQTNQIVQTFANQQAQPAQPIQQQYAQPVQQQFAPVQQQYAQPIQQQQYVQPIQQQYSQQYAQPIQQQYAPIQQQYAQQQFAQPIQQYSQPVLQQYAQPQQVMQPQYMQQSVQYNQQQPYFVNQFGQLVNQFGQLVQQPMIPTQPAQPIDMSKEYEKALGEIAIGGIKKAEMENESSISSFDKGFFGGGGNSMALSQKSSNTSIDKGKPDKMFGGGGGSSLALSRKAIELEDSL